MRLLIRRGLSAIGVSMAIAGSVAAQGGAGSAVEGRVLTTTGTPVTAAVVRLRHEGTGVVIEVSASRSGRFRFESVPSGGPYLLQSAAVGFRPSASPVFVVRLGERHAADLVMHEDAVRLPALSVTAADVPPPLSAGSGPAFAIAGDQVRSLPSLSRNVLTALRMVPQVVARGASGFHIGGQPFRLNAFQIDGVSADDPFGTSGQVPGGSAGARLISEEALAELRVEVAPFDARRGGFAGGLINAVSRSGTNRWAGSSFGFLQHRTLVGRDPAGRATDQFAMFQYGGTLGGPLIPDRLHLFAVADIQSRLAPAVGLRAGDLETGISRETADRIGRAVASRFGFDPGDGSVPTMRRPEWNLFGKLSWQPHPRRRLELSHTYVEAGADQLNRTLRNRVDRDGWQLSNSGVRFTGRTRATRLTMTSSIGTATHEVTLGHQALDEERRVPNPVPLFLVQAEQAGVYVAAGSVKTAQNTALRQRITTLGTSVTVPLASHALTVGLAVDWFRFRDIFFPGSLGVWTFGSVDSLELQRPNRYEVSLPLLPEGPAAVVRAGQLTTYVQDDWHPVPRLTITVGLRAEQGWSNQPRRNPTLAGSDALGGLDTRGYPAVTLQWAPRIGFRYALDRSAQAVVRGGWGTFIGRLPYAYLAQAFVLTGGEQSLVVCQAADGVPPPVGDIRQLPQGCEVTGPRPEPPATVAVFDAGLRRPEATKLALGLDTRLAEGLHASLDVLSSRTRQQLDVEDVNLVPRGINGEGRQMYGSLTATGAARPTRVDSAAFRQVYHVRSRHVDRALLVAAVVEARPFDGVALAAGYQWLRSQDHFSVIGSTPNLILQNAALDGAHGRRPLRPSVGDTPHRLTMTLQVPLPLGIGATWLYAGQSGTPFAYGISNDANADGVVLNDLFFVPATADDISLSQPGEYAVLEAFIAEVPCLRGQRGRIMARNSCRNPWSGQLDLRLSRFIGAGGGRVLELVGDIFNLPNLVRGEWGVVRQVTTFEVADLATVTGVDAARNRPRYALRIPAGDTRLDRRGTVDPERSRWRVQLGGRMRF